MLGILLIASTGTVIVVMVGKKVWPCGVAGFYVTLLPMGDFNPSWVLVPCVRY